MKSRLVSQSCQNVTVSEAKWPNHQPQILPEGLAPGSQSQIPLVYGFTLVDEEAITLISTLGKYVASTTINFANTPSCPSHRTTNTTQLEIAVCPPATRAMGAYSAPYAASAANLPWASVLIQAEHLAEIDQIKVDIEQRLVGFYTSIQKSIRLVHETALRERLRLDRKEAQEKEQIHHHAAGLSLTQLRESTSRTSSSYAWQFLELDSGERDEKFDLEELFGELVREIGCVLIEARLGRLKSIVEAKAAMDEAALVNDTSPTGLPPGARADESSSILKESKHSQPDIKPPPGSKKPKGLNDSKYS